VAALAQAVVVVEAPGRSGALNTARHARELGIAVLAAPHGAGARRLLHSGAGLVAEAGDVIRALDGEALRLHREPPADPDERRVLKIATAWPSLTVDEVALELGWSASRAAAAVMRLEIAGWVCAASGGRFEGCDPR
jgi:DNA processing protein